MKTSITCASPSTLVNAVKNPARVTNTLRGQSTEARMSEESLRTLGVRMRHDRAEALLVLC